MQKQIEQYIENIKKDYVGFGRPQTKTQQEVHENMKNEFNDSIRVCLLYTSPSPRDRG